jgi:hypothetical protein
VRVPPYFSPEGGEVVVSDGSEQAVSVKQLTRIIDNNNNNSFFM